MADRFFSGYSDYGFSDHIRQYFITDPVSGVDLKLDIVGDETLVAENDVTDHYVESNIAYQDQISLKPKTYTINGEVGELVWYQRDTLSQKAGQVAQRLEGLISFLPKQSRGFQQMKKTVMKAAQWVDVASNIWDRFDSLTPDMTKQQQAYSWLLFWRNRRSPLLVQSPWGLLNNYVITSFSVTQPRETKDKSMISITFKEFRLTSVSTVKFDKDKYQGNAMEENEPNTNSGTVSGEDNSISRQVTSEDADNPFYVEGNVGGDGRTEYVANVTDGTDKYKVWYDTRYKWEMIVTHDGQTIGPGTIKDQVCKAAYKAIENEMIKRSDTDYAMIMGLK